MSYFDEVYLKRINRDGDTIQERVRTRKEKEFNNLFLKGSKYFATLYRIDSAAAQVPCSIQPNKWNQDKILSNILVPLTEPRLNTGTILKSFQKNKEVEYDKSWIIVFVSDDITHGYQKYEVIELEHTISFADEYGETQLVLPVKFVNETSVFVQDKFTSYGSVTYREPLCHRKFITKNSDFLKKDAYFNYGDKGWKIVGEDNLSIPGVAYVSIEERLKDEPEPQTSKDILVDDDENFFLNHLRR